MKRIQCLEGIRTIGCVMIFAHHFLQVFYPSSPILLLDHERLAVAFFLVLTGFTAPLKVFRQEKKSWLRIVGDIGEYAVYRYLRLLPMVFAAIIMAYGIQQVGGYHVQEAADLYGLSNASAYYREEYTLGRALFEGTIGAFFVRPAINAPLWMISYELWGGVYACAMAEMLRKLPGRRVVYLLVCVGVVLVMRDYHIAALTLGMLASDMINNPENTGRADGWIDAVCRNPGMKHVYRLVLIVFFAGLPAFIFRQGQLCAVFAFALLMLAQADDRLGRLLENRLLVGGAGMTFAVYAIHWPIICSAGCMVAIRFPTEVYHVKTLAALVAASAATFAAAVWMSRWIEVPCRKMLSRMRGRRQYKG